MQSTDRAQLFERLDERLFPITDLANQLSRKSAHHFFDGLNLLPFWSFHAKALSVHSASLQCV
jgi:hypothetical protein